MPCANASAENTNVLGSEHLKEVSYNELRNGFLKLEKDHMLSSLT